MAVLNKGIREGIMSETQMVRYWITDGNGGHRQLSKAEWQRHFNTLPPEDQALIEIMWPKCEIQVAEGRNMKEPSKLLGVATHRCIRLLKLGKPCGRCGGSGDYSFNLKDGTLCYGCMGYKEKLPKLTKKFLDRIRMAWDAYVTEHPENLNK